MANENSSTELEVVVKLPAGYMPAQSGDDSAGFWLCEVGQAINGKLKGFASEGIAKTSKGLLVEVELLQPAVVMQKKGDGPQVKAVAAIGATVWVGVSEKLKLLEEFAAEGIQVKFFAQATSKIRLPNGNDMYKFNFQHDEESWQQLLDARKRNKHVAEQHALAKKSS